MPLSRSPYLYRRQLQRICSEGTFGRKGGILVSNLSCNVQVASKITIRPLKSWKRAPVKSRVLISSSRTETKIPLPFTYKACYPTCQELLEYKPLFHIHFRSVLILSPHLCQCFPISPMRSSFWLKISYHFLLHQSILHGPFLSFSDMLSH
jgi:hypothetical protein